MGNFFLKMFKLQVKNSSTYFLFSCRKFCGYIVEQLVLLPTNQSPSVHVQCSVTKKSIPQITNPLTNVRTMPKTSDLVITEDFSFLGYKT